MLTPARTYIDFDGVIVDTIPLLKSFKNRLEKEVFTCRVTMDDYVKLYMNYPYILQSSPVLAKALVYLRKMNPYHTAILTRVHQEEELQAKIDFLRRHHIHLTCIPVLSQLKKVDVVGDRLCRGSILIDDDIRNLHDWKNGGGIAVHFQAPSSQTTTEPYPVVSSLENFTSPEKIKQFLLTNHK